MDSVVAAVRREPSGPTPCAKGALVVGTGEGRRRMEADGGLRRRGGGGGRGGKECRFQGIHGVESIHGVED